MDRILEFVSNNLLLSTALVISFFLVIFSELRRKASGLRSASERLARLEAPDGGADRRRPVRG